MLYATAPAPKLCVSLSDLNTSMLADMQVAQMQAAALAEDPSIFDYDAHYDTVQQEKARARPMGQPDRSSKYIQNLMDKTKERKREQDIVYERR